MHYHANTLHLKMSNLATTAHETELECLMGLSDLQITKPLKQTEVLCSSEGTTTPHYVRTGSTVSLLI